ncbi:hypothetical protein [Agrobacterium sp. lyk4-40-TYG-31]|uniref:hypothetical protein n=1 Tax=Agrobacterium sp. lyk4-40-TYG-31 TaxID=3040276 RepID=UPI0033062BA9
MGELMVAHAAQCGLGGIVIFGAIRNRTPVRLLPVSVAGVTHRGPYKSLPAK